MNSNYLDPIDDIDDDQDEQLAREIEMTIKQEDKDIADDRNWVSAAQIIFSRIRKLGITNKHIKI